MPDTAVALTPATTEDLLDRARAIADRARPGEHLEVYVARSVETDVRVYEGEIEELSSAASAGVGIRVVTDGRQGFAYAGSLDELVVNDTLDQARDNATFATADDDVGLGPTRRRHSGRAGPVGRRRGIDG